MVQGLGFLEFRRASTCSCLLICLFLGHGVQGFRFRDFTIITERARLYDYRARSCPLNLGTQKEHQRTNFTRISLDIGLHCTKAHMGYA